MSQPDADRALEIKLEGQATLLSHAFETYSTVARALRRGGADALAAKAAIASQWVARNHDEVGRTVDAAIAKASVAQGSLAVRIRALPALRAEVVSRVEQRMSTTVARAGGLEPLLSAAIRRSHLAWTQYERDWQLEGAVVLRIPEGFEVVEAHGGRVIVSWNTFRFGTLDAGVSGSGGHFELAGKELIIPSWVFWKRRVRLNSIRTTEYRRDQQNHLALLGVTTDGVEAELFGIPSLYAGEFLCAVICHFTGARRDSHWAR